MNLIGLSIRNRYRIAEQRVENALFVRYAAVDGATGAPASVIILKSGAVSGRIEDVIRFRDACDAVARIAHPNVLAVREAGEVIGLNYVVTERPAGLSLDVLAARAALDPRCCALIAAGICRGLEALHHAGIVHRDLRPGTVLLAAPDETGERELEEIIAAGASRLAEALRGGAAAVKIDGVGLALIREYNETPAPGEMEKTFGCVAPELTGVLRRPVDERSDLYSAGIILYDLLAGAPPFTGSDVCALIQQHVARIPTPPSRINRAVPPVLDAITLKLIEKEPEDRYQSAAGAAADLEDVAAGATDLVPGRRDRNARLNFRTRIVGRERELAELKRLLTQSKKGDGALCLIGGESGSGKTRIVEELRDFVYAAGGVMIDGTCASGGAATPYAPFREALDAYLRMFRSYPPGRAASIAARLAEEYCDLAGIIVQLNPALKIIFGDAPAPVSLKPNREYKRYLMTIAGFLYRLGELENGLVIFLDDLQWADDGTLDLLGEIAGGLAGRPLTVIGTYRNDETAESQPHARFIAALREQNIPLKELTLANLDTDGMTRFVSAMLSEPEADVGPLAAYVHARSGGNPFIAIEMLKQLIAERALQRGAAGWRFDDSALSSVTAAPSIVEIILRRINLLAETEKAVLSRAAAIGKRFPLGLLYRICPLERPAVVAAIDRAAALQILEPGLPLRGEMQFAHDRVHEALFASTDEKIRAGLHRQIAAALEEGHRDDPGPALFDIVRHYHAAGDTEKLLLHAYPAGLRAQREYANDDAIRFYTMALDIIGDPPSAENAERRSLWRSCLERIGEIHLTVGAYDDAVALYDRILPEAPDDAARIRINKQLSQAYFKKGDWRNCERYARRGMRLLGERLPVRRRAVIASLAREGLRRLLHDIAPFLFVRARDGRDAGTSTIVIWFYVSLGWAFILSDVLKYIHSILRAYNLSESRIGPSAERAMMMTGYASILGAIPRFRRSIALHEKALRLRQAMGDTWGSAQTYQLMGFAQNWMGDYSRSVQSFTRAIELFQRIGDVRETGMSTAGLIHNYAMTADYGHLRACIDRYRDITRKTGDVYGISESDTYRTALLLETGNLDEALACGMRAYETSLEKGVLFTHCRACIELGKVHLEMGDAASIATARSYLDRAAGLYRENNFLKPYTVHLFTYRAEAMLASYLLESGALGSRERRTRLREIGAACREAERLARKWISHHGAALSACAQYHAASGRHQKARKLFRAAIAELARLGRQYELGRAMYHCSIHLLQAGDAPRAKEYLQTAYQEFLDIDAPLYVGRIRTLLGIRDDRGGASSLERFIERERLTAVLNLSQDIALIADFQELLDTVLSRAIEITGAQRGIMLLYDADGRLEPVARCAGPDGSEPETSAAMLDAVLTDQTHLIGPSDNTAGVRHASVICAPVQNGATVLGACYLDNPIAGGIFTAKEAQLLIAFITRTAPSIENALLQRRIRATSEKAEERHLAISAFSGEILEKAKRYLEENYLSDISREGLAAHLQVHPDHLGKVFKKHTGMKISEYVNTLRIRDAAARLTGSDAAIIDIAFAVGYESLRTFNRAFQKVMHKTPTEYREGH